MIHGEELSFRYFFVERSTLVLPETVPMLFSNIIRRLIPTGHMKAKQTILWRQTSGTATYGMEKSAQGKRKCVDSCDAIKGQDGRNGYPSRSWRVSMAHERVRSEGSVLKSNGR